jgi:predicted nucleic acid-binding Zn ribbon protein
MDNVEFENGEWWVRRKSQRERGVKARCRTCEAEFITRKVTPRKYCYECSPARPKVPRDPRPCETCGEDFKPLRQENRFCSNRCKGRGLRGEKHHGWKGGPAARGDYVNVRVEPDDPIAMAMRYESWPDISDAR